MVNKNSISHAFLSDGMSTGSEYYGSLSGLYCLTQTLLYIKLNQEGFIPTQALKRIQMLPDIVHA